MDNSLLIQKLNNDLEISLPGHLGEDELLTNLADFINQIIQTDFQRLVCLLYRTDVDETRLKGLLRQNTNQDAGFVIARLILEREYQKINSRSKSHNETNDTDAEKW